MDTAKLTLLWKYLEAWGQLASVFMGLVFLGKLIWYLVKKCCPTSRRKAHENH